MKRWTMAACFPGLAACGGAGESREIPTEPAGSTAVAASAPAPAETPATIPPAPAAPPRTELTILAGGDVSFGRGLGQILLRDPSRDLFGPIAPLLGSADVRFANLESQLSDQKGETQSPHARLVFTGPPAGAGALARGGFDVVSTANNHAWDYGKKALFETIEHLDASGVLHAGTGRDRAAAYAPARIERDGFRVALLAVTDIWNFGPLSKHKAAEHVARADAGTLAASVRAARVTPEGEPPIDAVVVSYHGGGEYLDLPLPRTRAVLRAAIDAGADAVLGHHPHVVQGVEWYRGKPILYSLGNLLMEMSEGRTPPKSGYLARLLLHRGAPPEVDACPFAITRSRPSLHGRDAAGLAASRRFFDHLALISKGVGGTTIAPPGDDGCARLSPPEGPGAGEWIGLGRGATIQR